MTEDTQPVVHMVRPGADGTLYCGAQGELPFKEGTTEGVTCSGCCQVAITEQRVKFSQRWFVHPQALNAPAKVSRLGVVVEWSQLEARGVITLATEAAAELCEQRVANEWMTAGYFEATMAQTWTATPANMLLFYVMNIYWGKLGMEKPHVGTVWQNNRGSSEVCADLLRSLNEENGAEWGPGHLVGFNLIPEHMR